jgi:hypothetical protein
LETFKIPLREIRKMFTKSELVMMAWRSSEIAYNMEMRTKDVRREINQPRSAPASITPIRETGITTEEERALEERLGPVAVKLDDGQGGHTLKKLTGKEAMHFMRSMGVPIMGGF